MRQESWQERDAVTRCRREIRAIESELLAGNPDVAGLCLALSDWSAELRIIEEEKSPHEQAGRAFNQKE